MSEIEELLERKDYEVRGVTGESFYVLNQTEQEVFARTRDRYETQFHFDNISDLSDLDRLLGLELLGFRYTQWALSGTDWDGLPVDPDEVESKKKRVDVEIRMLKAAMGIVRTHRIESEHQSVADYLQRLLRRAKEFGVHRDTQIVKAFNLWQDLHSLVGMHDRCDDIEREQLGVNVEDILAWLRDVAFPEFERIDEQFRKNQRLWIREIGPVDAS